MKKSQIKDRLWQTYAGLNDSVAWPCRILWERIVANVGRSTVFVLYLVYYRLALVVRCTFAVSPVS